MKKDAKSYKEIYGGMTGKSMNIGLVMGVAIALCTFIGYEIDSYFNCSPHGIIAGAVFGIFAGFVNMWEQMNKINDHLDEENDKRKEELSKD